MSDEPLSRHIVGEWVRRQRLANPVTKLILALVFDHAGPQEDGRWVAWVGSKTLAWEACLADGANGARTVRRHLADLEEAGIIEREERRRPNGSQTTNRIVLLVHPDSPAPGGRTPESGGPRTPEPAPEAPEGSPSGSPTKERTARAGDEQPDPRQSLPEGFPDELRPHARHVFRVLRDVARQHNAREVYPRAVGLALMAYPRRPLVETANALAGWAVDPPRPIKDVVGTYRTFLKRERDLAATERLAHDGTTTTAPAPHPAGVTPLHGRRSSNAEQVEQQIRALRNAGQPPAG